MRHPYYDKEGNLLYYVLRLENQQGEKITPPLSYENLVKKKSLHGSLKDILAKMESILFMVWKNLKASPWQR